MHTRQSQEKQDKMAAEWSMGQAIMQAAIEAIKGAILAVREADNPVNGVRPIHTIPRLDSLVWRQPTFDWKAADKYQELFSFKIVVNNFVMTNNYDM